MLTEADWLRILMEMGVRPAVAGEWAEPFAAEWPVQAFSRGIEDIRCLLPQVLHETSMLTRMDENLSYTPERLCVVWPGRFPTLASALPYAHSPQKLANLVYGGRMGNCDTGDGFRYRGRGPLMLTGRAGYRLAGELVGQDLETVPDLAAQPRFGLEIARHWWERRVPDAYLGDQVKLRRIVNGGTIGLAHVKELAALAQGVLG